STGKLFARLGTIDKNGEPNVHPVWYHFANDKIYFETSKNSRKAQSIKNKNTVYFCIDDTNEPYKGVRGKGTASFIEDIEKNLLVLEKILLKYTGSLENDIAKFLFNSVKSGESIIIEINPHFFGTWDHDKNN
ncbi:MAG: pyridoxamine 5'-phosphate oxidase family protein, partial [Nitrosopumilus sp.]